MHRKLGAEVGNQIVRAVRVVPPEPGVLRGKISLEAGQNVIVQGEESRVGGCGLHLLATQLLEHQDRILRGLPPQGPIEHPKQLPRLGIPAPP